MVVDGGGQGSSCDVTLGLAWGDSVLATMTRMGSLDLARSGRGWWLDMFVMFDGWHRVADDAVAGAARRQLGGS